MYEGEATYVARVEEYLKVVKWGNVSVLKPANADLFKAEVTEGCSGHYPQVRRPLTQISKKRYPMAVDDISHKVVLCDATIGEEEYKLNLS